MQCSPTGSVYKWTELLSVATLYTVMPLWGYRRTSVWMGCCLDYQAIQTCRILNPGGTDFCLAEHAHKEFKNNCLLLVRLYRDERAHT